MIQKRITSGTILLHSFLSSSMSLFQPLASVSFHITTSICTSLALLTCPMLVNSTVELVHLQAYIAHEPNHRRRFSRIFSYLHIQTMRITSGLIKQSKSNLVTCIVSSITIAGEDIHCRKHPRRAAEVHAGLHPSIGGYKRQREATGAEVAPLFRQRHRRGLASGRLDLSVPYS